MLYCQTPAVASPHVLVWANGSDINVLNPFTPGAAPTEYMRAATMAYLTRDDEGQLEPELASFVPTRANGGISPDGLAITFHLRPSLRWSDGASLTAADVVFTTHLILDPRTNISGRAGFELVTQVQALDAGTVVFRLSRPYAGIVSALFGSRGAPIVPAHLLQGQDVNTADYMQLPVGAGPFRYARWLRGDRVELEANPYYFRGRPKLDRLIFRILPSPQTASIALRIGEIDFWPAAAKDSVDMLADVPNLRMNPVAGVRPQILLLNWRSPIFGDLVVRKAARIALDRTSILSRIYHGGGVLDESLLPAEDPSYAHLPLVEHDVAKANALLEAAGWAPGPDGIRAKNGQRLVVTLAGIAGNAGVDAIFESIRADWRAVGIDVETRTYVPSIMFAEGAATGVLAGGKFDAALFSWGQVRAGEFAETFACKNAVPQGTNYGQTCDATLDALFVRYDLSFDAAQSREVAKRIQQRMDELLPLIIIVKRNEYYIERDAVTGLSARAQSPFTASLMTLDVSR
jgi:peptide/nickel transport system substrate-binding protein